MHFKGRKQSLGWKTHKFHFSHNTNSGPEFRILCSSRPVQICTHTYTKTCVFHLRYHQIILFTALVFPTVMGFLDPKYLSLDQECTTRGSWATCGSLSSLHHVLERPCSTHASNGPAIVLSFFLYKNNPNPACLLTAEIISLYSSAGSSVEF